MLASKLPVLPICSALIAHALAGCALIEPVSPDAQLPVRDAGPGAEEAEPESETDSLRDVLATAEPPLAADSAPIATPESPPTSADGGQENQADAEAACEADWQCAPSEVCSRVRAACIPRCQGDTCLGPTISDTNDRLVGDASRVCFADDSEAPGSGDFALRMWDGVADRATTLTRAQGAHALLLDAQYCYFHAAGALRRAALAGGCVELLQEMPVPPSRIWSDGAHVSWSAAAGDLYRVAPQQNARAERVDAAAPSGENAYGTSARVGGHMIERHAQEGRLQSSPALPDADASR